MIRSFGDTETERVFVRTFAPSIPKEILGAAQRKLQMLHAAERLSDLYRPPGNRLEKLVGTRKDQHSIRINRRWRICFRWIEGDVYDVEIVDYH